MKELTRSHLCKSWSKFCWPFSLFSIDCNHSILSFISITIKYSNINGLWKPSDKGILALKRSWLFTWCWLRQSKSSSSTAWRRSTPTSSWPGNQTSHFEEYCCVVCRMYIQLLIPTPPRLRTNQMNCICLPSWSKINHGSHLTLKSIQCCEGKKIL